MGPILSSGQQVIDTRFRSLWPHQRTLVPAKPCPWNNFDHLLPIDWVAYDKNFEQTASIVLEKDAVLYGYYAHVHFCGKYMRFYADYSDGTQEELINIANYSYNGQLNSVYDEPKLVPACIRITAVGAFDNSA